MACLVGWLFLTSLIDVDLSVIARTSSAVSSHGPEPVVSVTSDADVSTQHNKVARMVTDFVRDQTANRP